MATSLFIVLPSNLSSASGASAILPEKICNQVRHKARGTRSDLLPRGGFVFGNLANRPAVGLGYVSAIRPLYLSLPRTRSARSKAVVEKVTRELVKGKCLPGLLSGPFGRGVGGHLEVNNTTTIMRQHQEHLKHLETQSGHSEEVDENRLQPKCHPSFRSMFPGVNAQASGRAEFE